MKDKILKTIRKFRVDYIVSLYFIIQPILDIYTTFVKEPFEIFSVSINVLINLLLTFLILMCSLKYLYNNKRNLFNKDIIFSCVYIVIFLIYCVLHYLNMQQFDDNIFDRHAYGFLKESYFIFRTYIIPIILLYSLYRLNLKKEKIISIIKISIFIICAVIFLTNIFEVSLASYAEHGKLIYIDGSIFHWPFFCGKENFELYTSKGWFHSANELSAILLTFCPIIVYDFFERNRKEAKITKKRIFDILFLILYLITMNMLGTRTASLGVFAVLVCVFIVYNFFYYMKKIEINVKKFYLKYLVVFLFCVLLFLISPFYNKHYGKFKTSFEDRPVEEELDDSEDEYNDEMLADFIEEHSWNYYIEPILLDIYPVNNDIDFWVYIINRDLRLNSNYRIIKTDLYNRILKRNDNSNDKFLGIGYNDILTSEKDYAMQIYYYGIIGLIILIGPFIAIIFYSCYKILRYSKKYFNLENIIVLMGACVSLVVPYLTGHVFGIVFPMNYIVLILLLMLVVIRDGDKNES